MSAFLSEIWHIRWACSPNGTAPRVIFSYVSSAAFLMPHRSMQWFSALVRTLHSQLPSVSLWILCTLICACGHSPESFSHFLFYCQIFSKLRLSSFINTTTNAGFRCPLCYIYVSQIYSFLAFSNLLCHEIQASSLKSNQKSYSRIAYLIGFLFYFQMLLPRLHIYDIALVLDTRLPCHY